MKVLKVFIAIIVTFLLLCTQGVLMGAFACDKSVSSGSVTKAIQDTDFTQQLYERATATANRAADAKVNEFLSLAMQTDTASEFMGDYASSAINSVLYGEDLKGFTQEDLRQLTSDSLDELSAKSGISISDAQRKQALNYVDANGKEIVNEVNSTLPVIEKKALSSSDDMAAISQVQTFLGAPIRVALAAGSLLLGLILIALFWRSKLGALWWMFVSIVLGAVFVLLGTSSDLLSSYIRNTGEGTNFSLLLTGMLTHGFTFVGIASLILAALLLTFCLAGRRMSRSRED